MNLLTETLGMLKECHLKVEDIEWIGGNAGYMTWEQFKECANKEYDDGFGVQEVAFDLIIAGKGWWLSRYEYGGSEEWVYNTATAPIKPLIPFKNPVIFSGMWEPLKEKENNDEK